MKRAQQYIIFNVGSENKVLLYLLNNSNFIPLKICIPESFTLLEIVSRIKKVFIPSGIKYV